MHVAADEPVSAVWARKEHSLRWTRAEKKYLHMKMRFIQKDYQRPGTSRQAFEVILAKEIDIKYIHAYIKI